MFFSGCAGSVKHMREVPPGQASYAPEAGKALIVFMQAGRIVLWQVKAFWGRFRTGGEHGQRAHVLLAFLNMQWVLP